MIAGAEQVVVVLMAVCVWHNGQLVMGRSS